MQVFYTSTDPSNMGLLRMIVKQGVLIFLILYSPTQETIAN